MACFCFFFIDRLALTRELVRKIDWDWGVLKRDPVLLHVKIGKRREIEEAEAEGC